MKLKSTKITYQQVTTEFVVEIDKKRTVKGWVHRKIDDWFDEYDHDVEYDEASQKVLDKLTDEELDALDEIVSDIK